MKNLHHGSMVVTITDQLATLIEDAAIQFMNAGRFTCWPVACLIDRKPHVAVRMTFGPGIPFAISDALGSDVVLVPQYDSDSYSYIQGELEALDSE